MRFEKMDSVLWPKHLSAMPGVLEALRDATQVRPCPLVIDGTVVEFVPMNGAEGFKAVGAGKDFWNQLPYGQSISLNLDYSAAAGPVPVASGSTAQAGKAFGASASQASATLESAAPDDGEWPPSLSLPSGRVTAFDAYIIVDWSASQQPNTGENSIWWACAHWAQGSLAVEEPSNPSTRALAREQIRARLQELIAEGRSVLLGFDFPYGYPAGFAAKLGLGGGQPWRAVWQELARTIEDRQDDLETNNRYEIAAGFNRAMDGEGPF